MAAKRKVSLDSIEEIYNQVKSNLTVRHVMITADKLVFKDDPNSQDYDIVPIRDGDEITHYYQKADKKDKKIEISQIISSYVDLITLLKCLKNQGFFFVKDCDKIIGFVNISNMNTKSPLRLLLYTLISNIEIKLKEICSEIIEPSDLKDYFNEENWEKIEKKMRPDREGNINVDPYEYFDLYHYFTLVMKSKEIREYLAPENEEALSVTKFKEKYRFIDKFRNSIAHPTRLSLIEDFVDEADYLNKLIDKIDRTTEFLKLLIDARKRLRGRKSAPPAIR